MKKQLVIVASALTISLTSFSPAHALSIIGPPPAKENIGFTTQIEQQLTGTVEFIFGKELQVISDTGKRYHIYLTNYTKEQIAEMALTEGSSVTVEGQLIAVEDLQDFEYYQLYLPEELTSNDLKTIEQLYNQIREYDRQEKWEESAELWNKIQQILEPYYIAAWEPETFEEYFGHYELEVSTEDLIALEKLYNDYVSLRKGGDVALSEEKIVAFFELLNSYYQDYYERPSFDEYIGSIDYEITADDLALMKPLYIAANEAEINEEWDLATEKWNELHEILQPYYLVNYQAPSFEEYFSMFEFKLSTEDQELIKPLYEKVVQFDKQGDWEKSAELWTEIHELLEPYFEEMRPLFLKASQLIIDGKTF